MSRERNKTVALILAAGVGRRLGQSHEGPKVLLGFDGRSLLQRRLDSLQACGVETIYITVGHDEERVRAEVTRLSRTPDVHFVYNSRYREGSLISLAVQTEALTSGHPVLVMDGDVLHDSRIIARLLDGHVDRGRLLMDPELDPGDEPVKICLRGERVVDFRKCPDDAGERHGESVGFFRFPARLAAELSELSQAKLADSGGALEYEEAIRDLILADPTRFEVADVADLPWTEIDFAADVERARTHILPHLVD